MQCQRCGRDMQQGWGFCPACGLRLSSGKEFPMFDDIFTRFRTEFANMGKNMEREFEAFDLSKQKSPSSRGFTIRIVSGTGKEPKVYINTIGDVNPEAVRKQLEQFGIQQKRIEGQPAQGVAREAKETEEPHTEIKAMGNQIAVTMTLPGVMNAADIQITELENSIEVRANADKKAYFKILQKPPSSRIVNRMFSNERLNLMLA